jgi:hypothetical protein
MSIFDFLKDILFFKTKKSLSNIDNESIFSPYMINRWASMYSNTVALHCNILNKFLSFSQNKSDLFSLFSSILPKVPQRKIQYFKKNKPEETEADEQIAMIAKTMELSKREIEYYNNMLNTLK